MFPSYGMSNKSPRKGIPKPTATRPDANQMLKSFSFLSDAGPYPK